MASRTPIAAACTLVTLLVAPAVCADPSDDAKDLFARGRDLRARGDCASAVPLFRKASEIYPAGLGSTRNLAECEEQLGHFASSRRAWLDLKRALVTVSDAKYEGWPQDAEQAAARLAPKVGRVTIDVVASMTQGDRPAGNARGVTVTLDGEKLAPALVGVELDRDPGHHVARVEGERVEKPQETAIDLAAGDTKRVTLRFTLREPAPTPTATPTPTTTSTATSTPTPESAPDAPTATSRRTTAWVALGVGVAGLAGAGISALLRQSAMSDLDAKCPSHSNCDPSVQSTVDRGHTASTLATVLGVVGVVGVAASIALFATGASGDRSHAAIVVGPASVAARWSF